MSTKKSKKNNNKILWLIVLTLSLVLIAVGIGVYAWVYVEEEIDFSQYRKEPTTVAADSGREEQPSTSGNDKEPAQQTEPTGSAATEPTLPANPIDFESLQEWNDDIYAWIYIPNTGIDLPVFQASADKDDNYYMHRDVNGDYDFKGSIYSQRANKKDFSDPVTVLYGHHMLDDSMFSNLHYFRDHDFFAENEYFYIYTPGHILTYRIVSAHQYDERHILNSFDFSREEIFQEYIDYITAPRSMISDVREGVSVTTQDRIVTLSTCTEGGSARYLLQGVLISDEQTAS